MAYTDGQITLFNGLRRAVSVSETEMDNDAAYAYFVAAEAKYVGRGPAVIEAATRVAVFQEQWADASNQTDYTQNEESERLSTVAENKKGLLMHWQKVLKDALADDDDGVLGPVAPPPSHSVRLRPIW